MNIDNLQIAGKSSWWQVRLALALMVVCLYGWTVFEPFAGDALMHMMDDVQIHSFGDIVRTFYSNTNPHYQEHYRLLAFHRPVFNELYLAALKECLGVGSIWMRVLTLASLVGIAWAFLALIRAMRISPLSGAVGAIWLVFSPSLFFGLYEYGLAFSQLMVLLALLSLLVLQKYVEGKKRLSFLWFGLALLLVFLTVFTKESAVVWPAICLLFALLISNQAESTFVEDLPVRDNLKRLVIWLAAYRWFALAMAAIVVLYFFTRFLKLGSLTAIAGGIEQSPSLSDAVIKFIGFSLLALQVPISAIPSYMTVDIRHLGSMEIVLRLLLLMTGLTLLWLGWKRSRLSMLLLLACFTLAFLPIIKVSRNAPHYADLMAIPLSVALAIGFEALKEQISNRRQVLVALVIGISLFTVAALFAGRYVNNTDMWLARSQGFTRGALSDFASAEGVNEAKQIVGTSGMFSPEQKWALNHNSSLFGAAFIVNLGTPKEKFVLNSEKLTQNDKVMFVDFYPERSPRKIGSYPLPGYGRLRTAYFPTGFIRKSIQGSSGTYAANGYPVIRLECDNSFRAPFVVRFTSGTGSVVERSIDAAMNISSSSDRLALEFVAPNNTVSFQLVNADDVICNKPQVKGYFPFEPESMLYETEITVSPRFESSLGWIGKLTRNSKGAGVIVGPGADNPNVLSQRIPVKPFEYLKIVARASSVEMPTATGRLQINWVGPNDKFISSSGKTIEVTKEEKQFETYVVVPTGAIAGYLYVTPHAPEDVVRYEEMRALSAIKDAEK